MRKWFLALALIVLPLAVAAPALAVTPTTEVFTIVNFTYVNTSLCGFPVTFTENGTFKVTTYYDSAGNPVKSILTNQSRYTETATAYGKTLLGNYPAPSITSFPSGTAVLLGLRINYTVPGAGAVLLDAGRVVFDLVTGAVVFEAGQHQRLDGDAEAFCSYFAGP